MVSVYLFVEFADRGFLKGFMVARSALEACPSSKCLVLLVVAVEVVVVA